MESNKCTTQETKEITAGVLVDGLRKTVVAVKERENGDLIIILNRALFYREENELGRPDSPKILHQKYSVHRSLKSVNEFNTLTHILELNNGRKLESSHYTQAIKKYNKIAPIYAALSPSLSPTNYNFVGGSNFIELGNHTPSTSIFFYMVCVCAKDKPVDFSPFESSRVFSTIKISFSYFDIHILWAFALGPSAAHGAKIHFTTHRDRQEVAAIERLGWLVDGFESEQVADFFAATRDRAHMEFIRSLENSLPEQEKQMLLSLPIIYAAEDIFEQLFGG